MVMGNRNKFQSALRSVLPEREWEELLKNQEFRTLYDHINTIEDLDVLLQKATNMTIGMYLGGLSNHGGIKTKSR